VDNNLFDLTGKVAIVTGGVGILGRHLCEGLAAHGAEVAVVDLDLERAQELAASLSGKHGTKCSGFACNVADPESVRLMVRDVVEAHGEIHVLMNNAASKSANLERFFAPFEDYSLEEWRGIMSVNLDGMMLVDQAVGKQMVYQGKGGSIIHTASIYGVVAPDQRIYEGSEYMGVAINTPAVYSASKAGVIGLARYLATYWAPQSIRVNVLTPGGNESGQNRTFIENYSRRVPLGRMGQPPEMVGALLYLASDASSYVTGQNIVVDGGLSAW
jgi:NAD(P)-dependent dehydrogenase (short-subunit alcohol dehydrogenase family)